MITCRALAYGLLNNHNHGKDGITKNPHCTKIIFLTTNGTCAKLSHMQTLLCDTQVEQAGFEFPQPLTEKYRPRKIAEFVGLDKAKALCLNLIRQPKPINLLFVGSSGTGKTAMARALCGEMPGEFHHVPSRECDVDTVREIVKLCCYVPRLEGDWTRASRMHIVLCDEANRMTAAAQDAWLSVLDGTNRPPNTIFIFTANTTDGLEVPFLSRCQKLDFSSYGMAPGVSALLAEVWEKEAQGSHAPNFARIVKESNNNVRESLMRLETELMTIGG